MLPAIFRLTKKRDFEILFSEGRFFGGKVINAKVWKINPSNYPRRGYHIDDLKIGFVVGVKVSKSALKRNRAKRQMREVVRLLLKEQRLKTGYMMTFLAKPDILNANYAQIHEDIHALCGAGRLFV